MGLQRITLVDRTDFRLIHAELHGEDKTAVYEQRQAAGYNCARVLATCAQMFHLFPQEDPKAYFDAVERTADHLADHGSYMNLVAHADSPTVMPNKADQIRFWNQLGEIAQGKTNILLSAVNEADNAPNKLDALMDLQPIPGVLCSRGSNGGSTDVPPRPWMNWEELHTNGQTEWWRKAHNAMELSEGVGDIQASKVPASVSEQPRCPDQDGSLAHWEDAGGVGALLVAMTCFHSVAGKNSDLWGAQELQCAQGMARRALAVPTEFQAGFYQRPEPNPPGILRRYRRVLPDGRFWEETARV